MKRIYWLGLSLTGVFLLLCGCGGGTSPTVQPPSALSYATATAVYTQRDGLSPRTAPRAAAGR